MSKEIARTVALVTYGNLFLQGRDNEFDIEKLVTNNCYRLDFIEAPIEGIEGSSKVLASDANKWYKYLKDQGAKRLKLHYQTSSQAEIPDHISTAFVGGGSHWFVEVQFEKNSDLYLCDWIPPIDSGVDTRKTHYVRFASAIDHLNDSSSSVTDSRVQLKTILEKLVEFSGRFEHSKHWVRNFDNPLLILHEVEPIIADEFLPAGIYQKDAHQLIIAAFGSWVFGGMGSWNDMAFTGTDQQLYELLSENLYTTLCNAIISGVNSYP